MNNIKVNIEFKKSPIKWSDTTKRAEHLSDRMALRGIGIDNIIEAVKKGAKKLKQDGTIVSEFRWYKIIYREFNLEGWKKIYPITVIEV